MHQSIILLVIVFSTLVSNILNVFFPGTIHSDARPVHEERPGLRPRLLHHRAVHLQRPPGSPGANSQSQGDVWLISYLKILWPYTLQTELLFVVDFYHLWRKNYAFQDDPFNKISHDEQNCNKFYLVQQSTKKSENPDRICRIILLVCTFSI